MNMYGQVTAVNIVPVAILRDLPFMERVILSSYKNTR